MNGIQVTQKGKWTAWRGAIALGLGMLLARLGPYSTFTDLTLVERGAYWIGLTLLMWLQLEAALLLLRQRATASKGVSLGRAVAGGLLGAMPTAFEVAWAESLLRVVRDLGLFDLLAIYGDVALLAVPVALLLEWLRPRDAGAIPEAAMPASAPQGALEALLAAVPLDKRGEPFALAAEDHYLRLYTNRGEALIHRRFADALAAFASIEGLRVHRSWWVAIAAVKSAEREGDRVHLVLRNDLRVPVSRTYLMGVRQAGLLTT